MRVYDGVLMIDGREDFSGYSHLLVRKPQWVLLPAGVLAGGFSAGAVLGGLSLAFGQVVSPLLLGGIAGFVGLTLMLSIAMARSKPFSVSSLMSIAVSFGHAVIFVCFAWAFFNPEFANLIKQHVPVFPALPDLNEDVSTLLRLGPHFLTVFISYSIITPVSLMIFRYIALRK